MFLNSFIRKAALAGMTILLVCGAALAKQKPAKLAKKLLYGNEATRMEAVKAFNKLPMDAQYELVPDFMVALTDEDPQVRKVASRILKAMGVSTAAAVPDAKMEVPDTPPPSTADLQGQLAEEKKSAETAFPDIRQEPPPPPPLPTVPGDSPADPKSMRGDAKGQYADLQMELEREKKGQITLDMAALRSDAPANDTPLASVITSLKDPSPWVRAQAARRLGMIHPAPVETIPTLIELLKDKEVEVRRAAAAALGSFGSLAREAVPALSACLSDPDTAVNQIAAEAIQQIQSR